MLVLFLMCMCCALSIMIGVVVYTKWLDGGMKNGYTVKDIVFCLIGCIGVLIISVLYLIGWFSNCLVDYILK